MILAFAFAIGSASAKAFEGMLFILIRRPYSIGDFIHVSAVDVDGSFDGSPPWIVEYVTLFEVSAESSRPIAEEELFVRQRRQDYHRLIPNLRRSVSTFGGGRRSTVVFLVGTVLTLIVPP